MKEEGGRKSQCRRKCANQKEVYLPRGPLVGPSYAHKSSSSSPCEKRKKGVEWLCRKREEKEKRERKIKRIRERESGANPNVDV